MLARLGIILDISVEKLLVPWPITPVVADLSLIRGLRIYLCDFTYLFYKKTKKNKY